MTTGREILGDLGDGVRVARATVDDISAIVALLAADDLGRGRESDPSDPRYRKASMRCRAMRVSC